MALFYGTVTVTVCEPQDEVSVTDPLCFLTVTVKLALPIPLTVRDDGET